MVPDISHVNEGVGELNSLHKVDERIRRLIDTAPFGTHIWDKSLRIIDCNQETVDLFKLSSKQEYLENFNDFSPKFQPDGSLSSDAAARCIQKAFDEGRLRVEWVHKTLDGELIPSEMTLVRIDFEDDAYVVAYIRDMREEKRMLREKEAAQTTISAMFESNPYVNVLFDSSFRVVDCNPAGVSFMGFDTKEELLAGFVERMTRSIPAIQPNGHPSIPLAERLMTAVKEGRIVFETEVVMGGAKRNLDVEFRRIPYENSFAIVGYIYDMTDIYNHEKEILLANEQNEAQLAKLELETATLKTIFDSMPDFVFCKDLNLKYTRCNKRMEDFFGVREADLIGKDDADGLGAPAEMVRLCNESDQKLLDTGKSIISEEFVPDADGAMILCETVKVPIINSSEIVGLLGISRDITERKKAEEAMRLRESMTNTLNEMSRIFLSYDDKTLEEKMTAGVRLIADMMDLDNVSVWRTFMIADDLCTSQVHRWNRDAGGTVAPRPDLQNVPCALLTPHWEEILAGEQVMSGPVRLMPDPPADFLRTGVISVLLTPLFFNNEHWGFVLFEDMRNERYFEDISFLRSAAFMFANTIMRSEMEKTLKEALNIATSASRAKSDFLANMSHEIRTPMNAIIGMTNIGKSATDIERMMSSFTKIEDASKHLLGIINDILDMSKIEAGKLELVPVVFDFEKMLKRVVNVVSLRVDEKEQRLTIHVDRAVPKYLYGDDQRLAQIITNLLGNAVKFTPKQGTTSLSTYFVGEEDGVCKIKIAISDTGIGISPEQQAKLFQSFQQAESSTARKFGGTGLGLVISKSIVEMMGGEIEVESELGIGSTFTFTFHMKREENKQQRYLERGAKWSTVRVLVVDDDEYIREDLKGIIERLGADCDAAKSAEEALRLVDQYGNYNIYFIDWKMPGVDGIELTKELKKRTDTQNDSVVIMISSVESPVIAKEAKEAGVKKFLQKPLFPSTIADIISEYLGLETLQPEKTTPDIVGIFKGRSILLAEDVEINREIVLALLEPTEVTIDCAVDGVEAVRMFCEASEKYDMVFMDVQMPELDGYQATQAIRALDVPRAKTIPIVAMTANVFREDVEKCLEAGMNGHVGKPIDFDEVISQLRLYIH